MTEFRVWAPRAHHAHLDAMGHRLVMQRGPGGWWSAELRDANGPVDYAFVLDGGEPLPDPRSPWQPSGVHAPSRTVDHAAFRWSDSGWQPRPWAEAVVYELHIGTFSAEGTFDGAITHLPHLAGLGITHVELMPVAEFAGTRGWGYDGVGLYAPHHAYGGPDGLKRLVDACHAHGLAVIMDVVYNHLGPSGNYLGRFGPYFTERYATPWGAAVNFDGAGSHEVRRFVCDNALMWLRDYHCDGIRIDAVHAMLDQSAVHVLEQLAAEVRILEAEAGRRLMVIAESDLNDPRLLWPVARGGYALDAQWSDDFHHALHALLTGERAGYYGDFGTLNHLARAIRGAFVYTGQYSTFRQRTHGRPPDGLRAHRFLGYWQNHDQIGNRARGERSAHLVSAGRLRIGAALVLTAPFVPMMFQGEEWGASSPFLFFTDHDPELGAAVTRGRREECQAFGWRAGDVPDPQDAGTFGRSQLRWSELTGAPHATICDWYRRLIRLRHDSAELRDDDPDGLAVEFDEEGEWIAMWRGRVLVVANAGARAATIPVPAGGLHEILLASASVRLADDTIEMVPESVAILRRQE